MFAAPLFPSSPAGASRLLLTPAEHSLRVRQALQQVPWLQPLDPAAMAMLGANARLQRHVRNDRLLTQGEAADQLLILLEGQVHAERMQPGQATVLLQVVQPHDSMADTAVLDGGAIGAHYRAVRPCLVLAIQRQAFHDALRRWPALCDRYTAQVSRHLRAANARVMMLARCSVEERILHVLREWASPNAQGQWVVHDPLTQQELALVVAASREMTSRALAQLKLKGLIWFENWRQVVLIEPAAVADTPSGAPPEAPKGARSDAAQPVTQ